MGEEIVTDSQTLTKSEVGLIVNALNHSLGRHYYHNDDDDIPTELIQLSDRFLKMYESFKFCRHCSTSYFETYWNREQHGDGICNVKEEE